MPEVTTEKKQSPMSKIAGIPFAVILFVLVATLPALYSDHITRVDLQKSHDDILNRLVPTVTVVPTMVATPSATLAPSPVGATKRLSR